MCRDLNVCCWLKNCADFGVLTIVKIIHYCHVHQHNHLTWTRWDVPPRNTSAGAAVDGTDQESRRPRGSVMSWVSRCPERSCLSTRGCPSRVQLYWTLSPSLEQDTLMCPWDRHSEDSLGGDTGAGVVAHGNSLRSQVFLSILCRFFLNTHV